MDPERLTASSNGFARGYLQIARPDHWLQLVVALPGVAAALTLNHIQISAKLVAESTVGLLAIAMIASGSHVLDEIMDAPFDGLHPLNRYRLVSRVHIRVESIALLLIGIALGRAISASFAVTLIGSCAVGCIYNVPPFRSKDIPYLDVLTAGLNAPIVLLAGWFIVSPSTIAPWILLLSSWMASCYYMALKRYAEYQQSKVEGRLALYGESPAYFTANRLLASGMFYASASALFFAAFALRYRPELLLSFPLIAWVMAAYLSLACKANGDIKHPETLSGKARFLSALIGCTVVMAVCMFIDMPWIERGFIPALRGVEHMTPPTRSLRTDLVRPLPKNQF